MSSPNSPTLTHASSAPDGMDLFDFEAFEESPLSDHVLTSNGQQTALFESNQAMQDLYAQYFGQIDKEPLPTASDDSVINPLLLGLTPETTSSGSEDEKMDEDYCEEPTPTAPSKKKAATTRKAQPKRKVKSTVADLALPLASSAANLPTVVPKDKDAQGHLPHIVFPVPDYTDRPAPEEYAKLSSKEKRQLRNKISARNFRHRRKEYITTLEGEIADRDATISSLQEEVVTLKTENKTLRTDLDLLKKTVDELLNKARPVDHPPEPKFNARKDSPAFNVGSSSWSAGGFGALPNINVHTTFVPSPTFATQQPPQRNMNPLMDKVKSDALFHLPGQKEDESFFGQNPFTLDNQSMDRYRAQLYSNLTHNLNNLKTPAMGFKPSFFSALPSTAADADQQVRQAATQQTAFVAQEAASTLARGLLKSFWNTFTGSNPHNVADLLAGRAELKIVSTSPLPHPSSPMEKLDRGMSSLSVASNSSREPLNGLTMFGGRKA